MAEQDRPRHLRRALNLKDTVMFGVGVILGAGIYSIIGEAAALAGNLLWLSLLISAGVALLSAYSYAELSSLFPDAGGEFEYTKRTLGRPFAALIGLFAAVTGIVASATIALAFADYFTRLWEVPSWMASTGIVVVMALINAVGIQKSSTANIIATTITLGGLLVVVVIGVPHWGSVDLLAVPPDGFTGILAGGALAFFAYVGFEDVVKLAEETREPTRNIPKTMLYASLIVATVYLLVAVSVVSVVDWQTLGETKGPLAEVMNTVFGAVGATIIAVIALFATANSILTNILSTSRLLFDMAREWTIFKPFRFVAPKVKTPLVGIGCTALVAWLFTLLDDLRQVASITNFFIFATFLTVNIALIVVRLRRPDLEPDFRAPLNVGRVPLTAVLGALTVLVLLGYDLYNLFGPQNTSGGA